MTKTRIIATSCAVAIAWIGSSGGVADSLAAANAPDTIKYNFLRNSKWYVPPATLPAAEMNLKNGVVRVVSDQTVWDITGYRYGYFWGRTAAAFTRLDHGTPTTDVSCSRMLGSVTPDGRVLITFVGQDQTTTVGAVQGTGTLTPNHRGWSFLMQMSTGSTSVLTHWSYMEQCKPGQACERKLPGSKLSLSEFLAQCD